MYDGFQVSVASKKVLDRVRRMPGLVEHASEETGEVFNHSGRYDYLFFELHEWKKPKVTIRGSLHKYYTHGSNETLFTLSQVQRVVESLVRNYCIDQQEPCLQRIEFGVNIIAKCPEAVIDAAVLYHGRPATSRTLSRKHHYKEWNFEDYSIKLYRKRATLLRFEVHVGRMRELDGGQVRSLGDLCRRDVFVKCLAHLFSCVDEFVFVPAKIDSLPPDLREKWTTWRNDIYWQQLKPYQRTREKQRVMKAIVEYDLIDWNKYLKKSILSQGALMLATSEAQLGAMFSKLGLEAETVAGSSESCDRRTDSISDAYPSKSLVCLCLPHSVRNEGFRHMPEVVRVYSDVHLGGRGPPSKDNAFIVNYI